MGIVQSNRHRVVDEFMVVDNIQSRLKTVAKNARAHFLATVSSRDCNTANSYQLCKQCKLINDGDSFIMEKDFLKIDAMLRTIELLHIELLHAFFTFEQWPSINTFKNQLF
jgi:hypothetical protein